MGLRDESWCSDCGKSQPYSEDDVICGECTSEAYDKRSLQLINYMNLHLISLRQDSEELAIKMDNADIDMDSYEYKAMEIEDIGLNGKMFATAHLLSVARDILGIQTEEN